MFFSRHTLLSVAEILERKFLFYQQLDFSGKEKFSKRLLRFLHDKHFEGREGLVPVPEMEVLICATAIQLTFGLREYLLPFFDTIIIYPGIYYSQLGNNYHKGETNNRGAVILSWADFAEGLADPHDRLNLGLHEWAHALMVETQFGDGGDMLFHEYYNRWRFEAQDEFVQVETHYQDLFRAYGGTNIAEFFAVSVEVFFEDPERFHLRAPTLFRHMCVLLNQFPMGQSAEPLQHDPAGSPELHFPAGRTDYGRYIIYASIQVLLVFVITSNELKLGLAVLLVLVAYTSYYWYTELNNKKSILVYPHHLEVVSRTGKKLASYEFDNLAGLEISPSGLKYDIAFIFPDRGDIFDKSFRFNFAEDQIAALRKALNRKNLPIRVHNG